MTRRRPPRRTLMERTRADMNVTPLVDVMLVLLVVFMVTAPMLATGFHVDLPKTRAATKLSPQPPVTVVIGADGRVTVDGEDAPADRVGEAVEAHLGDDRTRPIRLRADGAAPYRLVVALLDGLASRGLGHVGLVTRTMPPAEAARGGGEP